MFDVIVDFIFEDGLLFVSIQNVSDEPAFDVTVTFDQQIIGPEGDRTINEMALFSKLAFLAPRKQIKTFLDTREAFFENNNFTVVTATVSYRDLATGQVPRKHSMKHDLEIYKDIRYIV
ncbi:MAG: hypothetical protein KTR29_25095 [Rhodothermaceae bacterium]|nr:hypothetical protein [Rhodothermaceae bacterium]